MKLKEFFIKNREILQLIYGIILIILIPFLIAFNTLFIINRYNKNLDVSLQRHALTMGRSIYTLLQEDLKDNEKIQEKIKKLAEKNNDFIDLSILVPQEENFVVAASSNNEKIGEILTSYYYKLAWMQPAGDGLAQDSTKLAATAENKQLIKNLSQEENRFWIVAMPMKDSFNQKNSLLTMRISSKIVDNLTNYNKNSSIFLLVLTILIVILFLSIAVRLWDYALLYKKIKGVDQMKDEFISMASHELRTPITAIRGYNSMILEGSFGKINKNVKKNLEIVQGASARLAELIEDLLNVSRIEQGRLKMDLAPQDINGIIKDIITELKIQSDAKNLKLKYNSNLKPFPKISADGDRLKQVLINLIGNAIKYTEKGSIEIITETKNKGKILEMRIKDTGIGMSAKAREKLFEKFYRVQNEKTRDITGTGLGLWITKQIVELMKGSITVDSIENVGTQITLNFPIV